MVENITGSKSEYAAFRDAGSPDRVLVVRIGRLGDTILATQIIKPLRQTLRPEVVYQVFEGIKPNWTERCPPSQSL